MKRIIDNFINLILLVENFVIMKIFILVENKETSPKTKPNVIENDNLASIGT